MKTQDILRPMTFKQFLEGAVKRSHPVVSGDENGTLPQDEVQKPAVKSSFDTRMENLAKRANVPVQQVRKMWDDAKDTVDKNHPNRFAIIMAQLKRQLGLN